MITDTIPHSSDLLEALMLNPEDWTLRLVYADYLEEHGFLVNAKGQRWQAENKKTPFHEKLGNVNPTTKTRDWWVWGNAKSHAVGFSDDSPGGHWIKECPLSMIPYHIFKHVQNTLPPVNPKCWTYHKIFQEAENSLAKALELFASGQT